MRSASFGRRMIEPSGHELVLIPGQEAPGPAPELANRDELKEQIRAALMSRIDPSVAGRIPRPTLRAEVGKLVSEIATEQRIQLNELEETALAVELTDDMVGLGPLEPLLEDDNVTDVLVNGPFDVFVERRGKLGGILRIDEAHVAELAEALELGAVAPPCRRGTLRVVELLPVAGKRRLVGTARVEPHAKRHQRVRLRADALGQLLHHDRVVRYRFLQQLADLAPDQAEAAGADDGRKIRRELNSIVSDRARSCPIRRAPRRSREQAPPRIAATPDRSAPACGLRRRLADRSRTCRGCHAGRR